VFSSTYTISPAASVPEPEYGVLVAMLLAAIVFGRRFVRSTMVK
jgi:hypothetical protein